MRQSPIERFVSHVVRCSARRVAEDVSYPCVAQIVTNSDQLPCHTH